MTIPNSASARFVLPTRIRSKLGPDAGYAAQQRLADRIAELPGMHTLEDPLEPSPCTVGVYLQAGSGKRRTPPTAFLFCKIRGTGISVEGLDDSERHQVLSRGWGKLENRSIQLFLPRDDDEFDVCWDIVYRAYRNISNPPARTLFAARPPLAELPEFSRTILC
jgi:hypothetical protein